MKFTRLAVLLFFVVTLSGATTAQREIRDLKPTVILIAVDGFRYDFFEKHQPPILNKIAKEGVRAKWLIPSFPTKTFPNHYTVVTGLYPQNHGIVANNIWYYAVEFSMSKREEVQKSRWWGGEPIWVTAEKQGQISAPMFYPGNEAEIAGERPTYWTPYDHNFPIDKRVDKVLEWIDLPVNERPTFYTIYFSNIDSAGHDNGPDAEQTRDAVQKVDAAIGRLVNGLKQRGIYGKANLIFFSDHGMAPVDVKRTDVLDDHFDLDLAERILWTAEIVQIFPKTGKTDEIAARLQNLKHGKCWKKADIPARLHYSTGSRVAPIVCSADDGAVLTNRRWLTERQKRADYGAPRGAHGYDNALESMRAMFVAHGRAFKRNKVVEPFLNVDIYELMCRILKIKPANNDGSFSRVKGMLR